MIKPSRNDLLAYLGMNEVGQQATTQLDTVLNTAFHMVRAYTRGRGFGEFGQCDESIAAVIVSCAARLYVNPTLERQTTVGPFSTSPGIFNGWSLAELAILNNYRRRAR